MKRRSFIKGLLGLTAFMGVTANAATVIDPKKQDETEFYTFFHKFNGFPINDNQKVMYQGYVNDWKKLTYGRRVGATALLVTLAAWRSLKGDSVLYCGHNRDVSRLYQQMYRRNMSDNLSIKPCEDENPPSFHGGGEIGPKCRGYEILLADNLKYMKFETFNDLNIATTAMRYNPNFKTLSIDTVEYD
jgi:hypothetical protein